MLQTRLRLSGTVLLLTLAVAASALAQLEQPEEARDGSAGLGLNKTQQQPSSVMSLLRDTATRLRQQQQATTTLPPTTTTTASSSATSKVNQVPTNTATATTTTTTTSQTTAATTLPQETTAAATTLSKPQFQVLIAKVPPTCRHNNQSYSIGQRWDDDCIQKCECVLGADNQAISACRNRCTVYNDPPGDGCALLRSRTDGCCLELVCATNGKQLPTTTTSLMSTERGQLNVTTTEIKFPASSSSTAPAATSTTPTTGALSSSVAMTTQAATTTTTTSTTTTTLATTQPQPTTIQQPVASGPKMKTAPQTPPTKRPMPPATTIQVVQSPTTLQTLGYPTTTTQVNVAPASREPKQVYREPRDFAASARQLDVSTEPSIPTSSIAATDSFGVDTIGRGDDELDLKKIDLCLTEVGGYRLNETWEDECGSLCRCGFRPKTNRPPSVDEWRVEPAVNMKLDSGQTQIVCSLPAHCGLTSLVRPKPSAECQVPQWGMADTKDKCSCPRLICAERLGGSGPMRRDPVASGNVTPVPMPTTQQQPQLPANNKCRKNGRLWNINETFNDECHSICQCMPDGTFKCHQLQCPNERAATDDCALWALDTSANFRQNSSEGVCCPEFVCREPRRRSCQLLGKEVVHGESVPDEIQPKENQPPECGRVCQCNDGEIVCAATEHSCPSFAPDQPPEDFKCAGQARLTKEANECCPKWVCFITEDYALKRFAVTPLNSTAVEVNYVLPAFALGHMGRAELNYTSVPVDVDGSFPSEAPQNARWITRKNIRTPDGYFHIESIKYIVNHLKPNHHYWFHLRIHFLGQNSPPLNDPLESELQQVTLPPLSLTTTDAEESSPITTTTTTTTTTPLPSTRILQPVTVTSPAPAQTRPSTTAQPAAPVISTTAAAPTMVPSSSSTTTTSSTTQQPSSSSTTSTTASQPQSTSTTTTTSTTALPEEPSTSSNNNNVIKPGISSDSVAHEPPCRRFPEDNRIDSATERQTFPEPLTDGMQNYIGNSLQRHCWHLLFGFITMTFMFTVMLVMYCKKTSRVIAPITSQSAYDNPTFPTKFISYCASQPHVLLVDENSQNYNNDAILAKQKNLEVDKTSPLHHNHNHHHHDHHQMNDIHHHYGKQHLI